MNEPKMFHIEPFSWLQRTLKGSYYWTLYICIEPFRDSKYVALLLVQLNAETKHIVGNTQRHWLNQ